VQSDRSSNGNVSTDCFRLLRMLADARVHSGEKLAAGLGCSRASVSRRMREIERLGFQVATLRGRGYRLDGPLDLLDRDALGSLLARLPCRFRAEVLDQCASTNSLMLVRSLNGASHASVLACEHQTAGRGRRGAQWVSTIGGSLVFSLLWRFRQGVGELSGLSLAVAVAVARALESQGAAGVGVKWPNDILLGGHKLGGILIEMTGDHLGPSAAVIGIGLNVRLPQAARRRIDARVSDLADARLAPSRTVLLAKLLEELAATLERFQRDGFAPFRKAWLARHAWQGRRVALTVSERRVAQGEAVGVAEDGALLLRSSRGVERFLAGELSLRRA
jgi:BirA family biotin operon repressor/biotin-[acetyl-CoA-carboxylase] ligase